MDGIILYSVISLGAVAAISAMVLFFIAKKFNVVEDPRIDVVAELLPGANCGGCGYPGCRGMAEAFVKGADAGSIAGLGCPPGGSATSEKIGKVLGMEVAAGEPMVAVLRCGGTHEKAPKKTEFDGPSKCSISHAVYTGEKGCPNGCLGLGDCVKICAFGAMYMDDKTGLPVIIEAKCVSCGACVKACPRKIIELRPLGRKNRRVWVNCRSLEKGAVAMKVCKAACIACGKCVKECPEKVQAITLDNFLAYIDPKKCIACGKCIAVCPTKAISATFEMPAPKPKPVEDGTAEVKKEEVKQ
ncbi:MAG TPA: RnfABCDGE type electron transport complex subunit B [bacterium]|nr:RnfABCDGE type electron transport complex subunit B [bacterium]HPS31472.1 RnfABCDGE type electron transport complex subunit B [bacterium]